MEGKTQGTTEIKTIRSSDANCYLIKTGASYFLIDSGYPTTRAALLEALKDAGCLPGNLELVVLTHGDIDHAGNCAYLQHAYQAKIAMHPGDAVLVEQGLEADKKCRSLWIKIILGLGAFSHRDVSMANFERFQPDVLVDEGTSLSDYGLEARVLHLPGHTKGSIGILTADGDLFAGDTLMNARKRFILSGWAENHDALESSVERLMTLDVRTVYPGHLKPFPMAQFVQRNQ
jgi:glyoxylase-like metal-dependent hydrolase (beta-lactamase superfamily II)